MLFPEKRRQQVEKHRILHDNLLAYPCVISPCRCYLTTVWHSYRSLIAAIEIIHKVAVCKDELVTNIVLWQLSTPLPRAS